MGKKVHRFAAVFYSYSHDMKVKEAMRESILEHGQQHPIVLYQDQILDGVSREDACDHVGVKPKYTEFKGTEQEALDYVVDANLIRRHMTLAQRAMAAAKLANMPRGRPSEKNKPAGRPISQAVAAKSMGVSPRTVRRAVRVFGLRIRCADDLEPALWQPLRDVEQPVRPLLGADTPDPENGPRIVGAVLIIDFAYAFARHWQYG